MASHPILCAITRVAAACAHRTFISMIAAASRLSLSLSPRSCSRPMPFSPRTSPFPLKPIIDGVRANFALISLSRASAAAMVRGLGRESLGRAEAFSSTPTRCRCSRLSVSPASFSLASGLSCISLCRSLCFSLCFSRRSCLSRSLCFSSPSSCRTRLSSARSARCRSRRSSRVGESGAGCGCGRGFWGPSRATSRATFSRAPPSSGALPRLLCRARVARSLSRATCRACDCSCGSAFSTDRSRRICTARRLGSCFRAGLGCSTACGGCTSPRARRCSFA